MARSDTKPPDFIDALLPWLLTPALIYVGIPVLFVATIVTLGLAFVHPMVGMAVPTLIGISLGASYKPNTFPPVIPRLPLAVRLNLLFIATLFAVLVVLADELPAVRWTYLESTCDDCGEEGKSLLANWLILGPSLVLAPMAFFAAATGSLRVTLATLGTLGAVLAEAAFLVVLFWILT